MALEYFLYRTDFNNTLVDRSNNSFTPLPPNSDEIYIEYFIPEIQPLYLYRESGGTIIFNNEETIINYIDETSTHEPTDSVTYNIFTEYSATTENNIGSRVYRTGDTMSGSLHTTANLCAAGNVCGSSVCASVWVSTPILSASTSIGSPLIMGSTCITSPVIIGNTSISAPLITGNTICVGNCLCSNGSITATSLLNVSGNTRLGSNLYLNSVSSGGTLSDYNLTYDPITQVVRGIPQGTGGTANVYCYADYNVTQSNSTGVNATYLTATWYLPHGRYEMEFNAIFGNDTSNRCAIVCFLRDGVVVGACNLAKTNDTNGRTTAYVTQDYVTDDSINHTVSIVHRQCGGGNSIVNYGAIRFRKTGE